MASLYRTELDGQVCTRFVHVRAHVSDPKILFVGVRVRHGVHDPKFFFVRVRVHVRGSKFLYVRVRSAVEKNFYVRVDARDLFKEVLSKAKTVRLLGKIRA